MKLNVNSTIDTWRLVTSIAVADVHVKCQSESSYRSTDRAQCEAEAGFAHDPCFLSCDRTRPRKKVRHLDRTARKRQGKKSLCNCKRNGFVSILDRWNQDDVNRVSDKHWLDPANMGKWGVLGFDDHTCHAKQEESKRYR